ncbi:MAG: c-type cytochrome [Pyrinomonadaceae bacterium]
MMKPIITVITFCFTAFFIASCSSAANNTVANKAANASTPAPTPIVSRAPDGKELYALNCMICHKENGTGGEITKDGKKLNAENLTTDKIKKMTDEKLIGYVRDGIEDEGMPAFKDKLTQEEIRAAVAHIRILQANL